MLPALAPVTVNVPDLPGIRGMPMIPAAPEPEISWRPGGSAPAVTLNVYLPPPLVAERLQVRQGHIQLTSVASATPMPQVESLIVIE